MAKEKSSNHLWKGVGESDFLATSKVETVDIGDYNLHNMQLYTANVNMWRHFMGLSDSLKPVERRILYSLYLSKTMDDKKKKSAEIVGNAMARHGHGDNAIYEAMVGMSQPWKRQCPLIKGKGNFGNSVWADTHADKRYTEASMSKYAKECFFEDYDDDCVEEVFNSASDSTEPMSFPAKFPNIIVNGGMGIAIANAFRIPPYNIYDIIRVCKAVAQNPKRADVFMIPDLPSGCQLIDDGECFKQICDTGKGVLKMRGEIKILRDNKHWILRIVSLPWMSTIDSIARKIREMAAQGTLPVKDLRDKSEPVRMSDGSIGTELAYDIYIDIAHDPQTIIEKIYNATELQKSVSIDFKVVYPDLTIRRANMREIIVSWLDERRSYKRRLFNRRLSKIAARIELLDILLYLVKANNINKTMNIIKGSNYSEVVDRLIEFGNMSSYQADKIAAMRLSAFTKDAEAKYREERDRLIIERENLINLIGSEKKIDKLIIDELEDLRKYAPNGGARRSQVIAASTGKHIADTSHSIVVSKEGYVKKLNYSVDNPSKNYQMGSFKTNDYPAHHLVCHNRDSVMMFDTFGAYSVIPLHDIDNTEPSNYGQRAFDLVKLSGKIISVLPMQDPDVIEELKKATIPYLVTITSNGYGKKTPLDVFLDMKKNRNIRAMKVRDDDSLFSVTVNLDSTTLLIYSKKGVCTVLNVKDLAEQTKDSMGVIALKLNDPSDSVGGVSVIKSTDECVVIVTEKGVCKKVDLKYIGSATKRNSVKDQGSIITLDAGDAVKGVVSMRNSGSIDVVSRNSLVQLSLENIPDTTKKAKGKRLISTTQSSNIIMIRETPVKEKKKKK